VAIVTSSTYDRTRPLFWLRSCHPEDQLYDKLFPGFPGRDEGSLHTQTAMEIFINKSTVRFISLDLIKINTIRCCFSNSVIRPGKHAMFRKAILVLGHLVAARFNIYIISYGFTRPDILDWKSAKQIWYDWIHSICMVCGLSSNILTKDQGFLSGWGRHVVRMLEIRTSA
jgi:hypothetical protein